MTVCDRIRASIPIRSGGWAGSSASRPRITKSPMTAPSPISARGSTSAVSEMLVGMSRVWAWRVGRKHIRSADGWARRRSPGRCGPCYHPQPMHLLIVNQYGLPTGTPGITRHGDLGAELARRGHEVTVIASRFNYLTRSNSGGRSIEDHGGVRFRWLDTGSYRGND